MSVPKREFPDTLIAFSLTNCEPESCQGYALADHALIIPQASITSNQESKYPQVLTGAQTYTLSNKACNHHSTAQF